MRFGRKKRRLLRASAALDLAEATADAWPRAERGEASPPDEIFWGRSFAELAQSASSRRPFAIRRANGFRMAQQREFHTLLEVKSSEQINPAVRGRIIKKSACQ